jgi:hypothetical protein
MSDAWTIDVTAPDGEAVELKHLRAALQSWRGIKKTDDTGRRWELGGGTIELAYQGRSARKDLCDRILCTYNTRQESEAAHRVWDLAKWAATELGGGSSSPASIEANLNGHAAQGWHFVGAIPSAGRPRLIFKRGD